MKNNYFFQLQENSLMGWSVINNIITTKVIELNSVKLTYLIISLYLVRKSISIE